MKTKFLTFTVSALIYGTLWAQVPYTKPAVKSGIHTQQIHAGRNLVFKPSLNPGNSVETEKYVRDSVSDGARIKGELDHVGAYDFGSRITWLASLRIFFYKRKLRAKD